MKIVLPIENNTSDEIVKEGISDIKELLKESDKNAISDILTTAVEGLSQKLLSFNDILEYLCRIELVDADIENLSAEELQLLRAAKTLCQKAEEQLEPLTLEDEFATPNIESNEEEINYPPQESTQEFATTPEGIDEGLFDDQIDKELVNHTTPEGIDEGLFDDQIDRELVDDTLRGLIGNIEEEKKTFP
jgi:hypothetical protein